MLLSWFSYSLERPYPQRWLTPVVIVGGAVCLVLFSLLNYASSGFTLAVQYSSNPNSTAEVSWFGKKLPSLLTNKLRASCQSTTIPRMTQLLTNNTALTYQITSIRSSDGDLLSSLVYTNNKLENCSVETVSLEFDRATRTAIQIADAPWGINTRARITCLMALHPPGYTTVNLTAAWDPVPDNVPASTVSFEGSYDFLGRNSQNKSSLLWGEALLYAYYDQMRSQIYNDSGGILKGAVLLEPRVYGSNITSLDYYSVDFRFVTTAGDDPSSLLILWRGERASDDPTTYIGGLAAGAGDWNPNMWIAADSLAKAFQSTILTDLGQIEPVQSNLLTDPEQLQHFTSNLSSINSTKSRVLGLPVGDYLSLKDTTGPLSVAPSTLTTDYLCNVPQRKPWGSLLVAIVVADLVFMQALWMLFKLAVGTSMRKKNPTVDWCEGCLTREDKNEIPLTSIRPHRKSAVSQATSTTYETLNTFDDRDDQSKTRLVLG